MRDYTPNNYCDFLWISDLIEVKRNARNTYTAVIKKNNKSKTINFVNVTIFGTIIEIKPIGNKGYLYHVDDGTGVIACKHNEGQFEEVISVIESEQHDVLNETAQLRQCSEESLVVDSSMDDSVFNDRSIQSDEINFDKKSQLMVCNATSLYKQVINYIENDKRNMQGFQSMWNDIYQSFTNLFGQYKLGDVVHIEGKLYTYFNTNQIYINSIRPMDLAEEIIKVSMKLEDGYEPLSGIKKQQSDKRMSGLMTFDHIHHLNVKLPTISNIKTPPQMTSVMEEAENQVVTPNLGSTITFDTFNGKI